MRKAFKISLITLSSLIVILAIAAFLLTTLVNTSAVKQQINQKIYHKTGQQIDIKGDLHWSFTPWLGLEITQAQISNPAGFSEQPLLSVDKANIRVKLLPLLSGKLVFGDIILQHPTINLIKNSQGQTNWQALRKPNPNNNTLSMPTNTQNSQENVAKTASINNQTLVTAIPTQAAPKPVKNKLDIQLSDINIRDGQIVYQDQQHNQSYQLDNINFTGKNIKSSKPASIKLSFNLKSQSPKQAAKISGNVSLQTKATVDLQQGLINLSGLNMTTQIAQSEPKPLTINSQLSANIVINLLQHSANIQQLNTTINNVKITGQANATQLGRNPNVNGSIKIANFNPSALLKSLNINLSNRQNPNSWQRASAALNFKYADNQLAINPVEATIDASHLNGNVVVKNSAGYPVQFNLSIDKLNLDNYINGAVNIPTQQAQHSGGLIANAYADTPPAAPANNTIKLQKLLQQLNAKGNIRIGQLQVMHINGQNVNLNLAANKGIITLNPITAQVYGGSYQGNIRIDANTSEPTIAANESLRDIQAAPLLNDLIGYKDLSGNININNAITTHGNNTSSLLQNLNGHSQIAFTNGQLKGIDLNYELSRVDALVSRTPEPQQPSNALTPIGSLTGSFTIVNGVANNNDLTLRSPSLNVDGKGTINLATQQWHYQLKAATAGDQYPRVKRFEQMLGGSIPLIAQGDFHQVKIAPDMHTIGKALLSEQSKRIQAEASDSLKQRFGEQLQQGLQNFFQQSTQ